jgi:hypothetical protein
MKKIILLTFIFISNFSYAQIFTYDNLNLGLNIDTYYSKNSIGKKATSFDMQFMNYYIDRYFNSFNYTTPIEDKIRLYNASLTADYLDDDVKGKITVQYGDIEDMSPDDSQYIREANAGFSPVKDLWFEAGIFFQPFSAESLLPSKNFLTSTAIQTGFEPVRVMAAKVKYNFINNFSASILVAEDFEMGYNPFKNKWYGITLDYSPFSNFNVKLNNFTGNTLFYYISSFEPYIDFNSKKVLRIFNNLVLSYKYKDKLELLSGIDFTVQNDSRLYTFDRSANIWGFFLSGRYNVNDKLSVSARGEYFNDKQGVYTLLWFYPEFDRFPTGMEAGGFAACIEYRPKKQLYVRLEMNYFEDKQRMGLFAYDKFTKFTGIASMGLNF